MNDQSADDNALLARFAAGETTAARLLTRRHTGRLMALALRFTQNRALAEDLVQETMMRLWHQAPNWEDTGSISGWTAQVLRNLAIDELRKAKHRNADPIDDINPADPAETAPIKLQNQNRRDALQKAINELPQRQATAFIARHLDGDTNPQIADQMGLSVEAVESLIARAKRQIAATLRPQKAALGYRDEHE